MKAGQKIRRSFLCKLSRAGEDDLTKLRNGKAAVAYIALGIFGGKHWVVLECGEDGGLMNGRQAAAVFFDPDSRPSLLAALLTQDSR